MPEAKRSCKRSGQFFMLKEFGSIALLTPALLGIEGIGFAAEGHALSIAELDPSLRESVCQNNWDRSIRAIRPMIGNSSITPERREELVRLHHQLQDWRALRTNLPNLPGCEGIPVAVEGGHSVEFSRSTPLNFAAGFESVWAMRYLPSGHISIDYAVPQNLDAVDRGCRVVDATGRRIDLSFMCTN
jgi:hypothetical protein